MREDDLKRGSILIADDALDVAPLEQVLRAEGYINLVRAREPGETVALFSHARPDLIVIALRSSRPDRWSVLTQLRQLIAPDILLPVLVLSGEVDVETRRRALLLGATDLLAVPFDPEEMVLRVKNLLNTRFLHRRLLQQNAALEESLRERAADLETAQFEVLERLALAAELRADESQAAAARVGLAAGLIAETMELPAAQVELIRRAAPLHDIGMIGVPDRVLQKPGKLTEQEQAFMRHHTVLGARMLAQGRTPAVSVAEQVALAHHERWDGSGYPRGLAGETIPLPARIVAVADVYEALTHPRPYKVVMSEPQAASEIRRLSGRHFDPRVVSAFLEVQGRGLIG